LVFYESFLTGCLLDKLIDASNDILVFLLFDLDVKTFRGNGPAGEAYPDIDAIWLIIIAEIIDKGVMP
jgi:hypothetical protein